MDFKRYNLNLPSSEIYKYRPIFNFKPLLEDFIPLVYKISLPYIFKGSKKGQFWIGLNFSLGLKILKFTNGLNCPKTPKILKIKKAQK